MPDKEAKLLPGLSAVEEAEHRAYRRGQQAAELKSSLEGHFKEDDRRFGELKGSQEQTTRILQTVVVKVDDLGKKVDTAAAVTAARAEDAKKAADDAISTRAFIITMVSFGVTILGALAASGHL